MKLEDIIKEVSKELGIPLQTCELAYKSMWKFIRLNIEALPLKEHLTDEQFDQLRPNFNIPSLGKLYVTKENYNKRERLYQHIMTLKNKKDGNNIQDKETETTI